MMEPVPQQDIARINAGGNTTVLQGPELRTIFLGMDQKRDELLFSSVKGKNPFKDKRVRQAFYQAIDIETIKSKVMRGASTPTALMIAPGVNGFAPSLNKRLPYDVDAAKKLLADAGYPNGFEVGMNCPNDRYVNDSEICQAVAAMLARIGVKVNLMVETKDLYFPKILSRNTSFYMLGWTPSTIDAHDTLNSIVGTPDTATGRGQFNLGVYSNPTRRRADRQDPVGDGHPEAQPDDRRRDEDARGRHRPHPAAPAGARVGREEEHHARAAADERHAAEMGRGEVKVATVSHARLSRRRPGRHCSTRAESLGDPSSSRRRPGPDRLFGHRAPAFARVTVVSSNARSAARNSPSFPRRREPGVVRATATHDAGPPPSRRRRTGMARAFRGGIRPANP